MNMERKEYMDLLKSRYVNAKTEAEREEVISEIKRCCDKDPEGVASAAIEQVKETIDRIETTIVRQQMESILPFISLSYMAKKYFNKSRQWLYQRINGSTVNGKMARFTRQEIEILNHALKDMGHKLLSTELSA